MKKIILRALCIILCLSFALPFSSCQRQERQEKSFFLMDTPITVTLYTDKKTAEAVFAECRAILSELDNLWSRTKEESDVGSFNIAQNSIELDPRTIALVEKAMDVTQKTNGAFDVTVAPLVNLWQSSEEKGTFPTEQELQAALALVGASHLNLANNTLTKTEKDVQIDFGGIGKGAAISALISYLEGCDGVRGGLVSFGSNVAVFGEKPDKKPFRIALKNPKAESGYAGVLNLKASQILSVSGDYERYYTINGEKYHHILDPETGYPAVSGLCSVAVICSDGALADALSTALFVMGEKNARAFYESKIYDFEAVFIDQGGNVTTTAGLADIFEGQE